MPETVLYRLSDDLFVASLIQLADQDFALIAWDGTAGELSGYCADPQRTALILIDDTRTDALQICAGLRYRGLKVPAVIVRAAAGGPMAGAVRSDDMLLRTLFDSHFVDPDPVQVDKVIRERFAKDRNRRESVAAVSNRSGWFSVGENAFLKNQAYIEQLLDHAPVGVILTNQQGCIAAINRYGLDVIGAEPASLINTPLFSLFPAEFEDTLSRSPPPGYQQSDVETDTILHRPAGGQRHVAVRSVPLAHFREGMDRMILFQDVTDRHVAEERLRQAQKLEAVGRVTGGVAHHFNNLMHIILANLEMAKEGSAADRLGFIQSAIGAVTRGKSLNEHLLSYSRSTILNPVRIELNQFVSAFISDLKLRDSGEISIWFNDSGSPVSVEADPEMLSQALTEVVQNAINAMRAGGEIQISISQLLRTDLPSDAAAHLEDDLYALVQINDTGHGMPAKILNQAVEPFFTTRTVGEGNGLGLSMVHGFVSQSRGAMVIESAVDEGTKVKLFIPIARP